MWFLDSSVSFHMTLESTHLPSMLYPNSHLSRLFLSLDVAFFLLHLFMSLLFCISKLAMHLMCANQITDHDCRIILEVDSGSPTGASVGLGIMILRSFGSFTGCVFFFLSVWLSSFTHFIYPVIQFCLRDSYIIYHYFYAVALSSMSSLRL